ncbi:hypothetical protein GHK86_18150 [Acidimicrobiaceae bacterium USS-CC1]|uniref:ATP synthase subunit I n=1 Tax=Acidiferrimicrobium australe TaxID=2664430 RepID=A0ABW9QXN5_9ACTN|nr:hypothetical protein [Acidiferrimicrobium australe]
MASETGLTGVLGGFPVLGVERIVRRTLISAVVAGLVAAVVAIVVGYPLIAPGLLLGLALAVLNHRVFQSSAMRYIDPEGSVRRKPFTGSVLARLGLCTAVAIVLLIWVRAMGFGVIAGLAIFQGAMLVNAVVALIHYQRVEIGGGMPRG